jgi:hypothetical protein
MEGRKTVVVDRLLDSYWRWDIILPIVFERTRGGKRDETNEFPYP